jgi:hypothetical protein
MRPALLVAGINRSGTSAYSHMLAALTGLGLLDDPEWAISGPAGPLSYRSCSSAYNDLCSYAIVKCPRMCEVLDRVMCDFPRLKVVILLRDPRDVWCSITEKVALGRPTRMLDNHRFGNYTHPLQGFVMQARHYYDMIDEALRRRDSRVRVICYENFFRDRLGDIVSTAAWSKLSFRVDAHELSVDTQYGPAGHKLDPRIIRGPGRWREELRNWEAEYLSHNLLQDYDRLCRAAEMTSD